MVTPRIFQFRSFQAFRIVLARKAPLRQTRRNRSHAEIWLIFDVNSQSLAATWKPKEGPAPPEFPGYTTCFLGTAANVLTSYQPRDSEILDNAACHELPGLGDADE